jgi:hypothetical protein
MSTMYDYDVQSIHDPCNVAAEKGMTTGAELLLPGTSLVNVFPVLKYIPTWFPGASTQRKAAEVKRLTEEMKRINRKREMPSPPSCQISWRRKVRLVRQMKRNAPPKTLPIRYTVVISIYYHHPEPFLPRCL